jgi:hypothetical protein
MLPVPMFDIVGIWVIADVFQVTRRGGGRLGVPGEYINGPVER